MKKSNLLKLLSVVVLQFSLASCDLFASSTPEVQQPSSIPSE